MKTKRSLFEGWALFLSACALSACGGEGAQSAGKTTGEPAAAAGSIDVAEGDGVNQVNPAQDPLAGSWFHGGSVPENTWLTLTFNLDHSFVFEVDTVPPGEMVGADVAPSCVVRDTYLGTYIDDADTLTWTLSGGTFHEAAGCIANPDSPGMPITADRAAISIKDGYIPPMSLTFAATQDRLVITPGVSAETGSAFYRSDDEK